MGGRIPSPFHPLWGKGREGTESEGEFRPVPAGRKDIYLLFLKRQGKENGAMHVDTLIPHNEKACFSPLSTIANGP